MKIERHFQNTGRTEPPTQALAYTTVLVDPPYFLDSPITPNPNDLEWRDSVPMNQNQVMPIWVQFAPICGRILPVRCM
jgi:hypothetical protein